MEFYGLKNDILRGISVHQAYLALDGGSTRVERLESGLFAELELDYCGHKAMLKWIMGDFTGIFANKEWVANSIEKDLIKECL